MKRNDYSDCKGIYHLIYKSTIVYIGMSSTSVLDRIFGWNNLSCEAHINTKIFNSIEIFDYSDLEDVEIKKIEYSLINKYKPFFNITSKNNSTIINKDIEEILSYQRNKALEMAKYF